VIPTSYSPDGSGLLVTIARAGRPRLGWVPLTPAGVARDSIRPLFSDGAIRAMARFSPDGRSIAYLSDETGKPEVYISAWGGDGPAGAPVLVSNGGGANPMWSADGRRLYYSALPGDALMSVAVAREPRLAAAPPARAWDLEQLRAAPGLYDVLPGGDLLLIQKGESEDEVRHLDVALRFDEELRARLRNVR
jgi:dipeptidyl aminopeptidase/acylaminoacyl peptidase